MSAFDYIIQITGDCQNNGSGVISLLPSGGTPPYTVDWVEPQLGIDDLLIITPSVRTGLTSGTYAVRVNDSTLPVNSEFYINIPISNGVCASVVDTRDSFCNANNGAVTGTSSSEYSSTNFLLFSGDGTYINSASTNTSFVEFNSLSEGVYYLVAQDLGGCTGRTSDFLIENSDDFDFGLYVVPNSSCGGTPIGKIFVTGITGNSPYTYQWSNGSIQDSITGLTAGFYSVAVTDANGCTKTKSGEVVNVPPIGIAGFSAQTPTCLSNDGSITVILTGGTEPFYYSASTGFVAIDYSRTYTLSNLAPGDYSIQVTDAGLCTVVGDVRLNTPTGFISVDVVGENSVCSANNGQIIINVVGGTAPYTYTLVKPGGDTDSITTLLTTQTFSNLTSGNYTVFIETTADPLDPDSTCTFTKSVTILAENKFTITTSVTGTTCGNNNGIVQVIASTGGTLPYIYAIDGVNDLDGIFTNLTPGQHVVTVTDNSGCVQTQNVIVPSSQSLDFSLYTTSCGIGNEGRITAFIGSGTPPFSYNWSNNVQGNPQEIQVSGLTAGTYSLTIVDANGCSKQRSTSISCVENLVSFQSYVMGAEVFSIESPTKLGILQMLNEGFADLTSENTSCNLISATYTVKVSVNPLGLSTQDVLPFTSTTLNQAPADNLYYDTVRNLLLTIPGIGSVTVDSLNNQITIQTSPNNTSLNGQEIIIDLIIIYDIICLL
jgi:hypothetical protein